MVQLIQHIDKQADDIPDEDGDGGALKISAGKKISAQRRHDDRREARDHCDADPGEERKRRQPDGVREKILRRAGNEKRDKNDALDAFFAVLAQIHLGARAFAEEKLDDLVAKNARQHERRDRREQRANGRDERAHDRAKREPGSDLKRFARQNGDDDLQIRDGKEHEIAPAAEGEHPVTRSVRLGDGLVERHADLHNEQRHNGDHDREQPEQKKNDRHIFLKLAAAQRFVDSAPPSIERQAFFDLGEPEHGPPPFSRFLQKIDKRGPFQV